MEGEKLDPEKPEHMYWVYVCTKQEDMVKKKRQRAKRKKDPRGEKRVTQRELGTYI